MKICVRCGDSKPLSEFNRSARNKDGLHSYCRECQKAHYRSNSGRHMENVRRTSAARMEKLRGVVFAALASGCVDCGATDIRVLEFDHVRGDKVDGISQIIRKGYGARVLEAEIAKCDVRCRNCHAIVTCERLGQTWHDRFLAAPAEKTRSQFIEP